MSRVIPRVDISEELEDWSEAIYGEEVRSANVSALTKLQQQTNDACDMFEEIAEDFDDRDEQWAQDLQSVDESVEAAAGSASAAAASETAAAGSASAASASETAAAASQAAAASSEEASEAAAERAEEAAESVESPVSYAPQTLTPAQQQQAAENIGLGDVKASLQNTKDMISDAWNSEKTYTKQDYCIYNDTLWKCKVQHSGQTPVEGTYWTAVSVAEKLKELNIKFGEWFPLSAADPNVEIVGGSGYIRAGDIVHVYVQIGASTGATARTFLVRGLPGPLKAFGVYATSLSTGKIVDTTTYYVAEAGNISNYGNIESGYAKTLMFSYVAR